MNLYKILITLILLFFAASGTFAQHWDDVGNVLNGGEVLGSQAGSPAPNIVIQTDGQDHTVIDNDGSVTVNPLDRFGKVNIGMQTPTIHHDESRLSIKSGWGDWARLYNSDEDKYWSFHNPQDGDAIAIGRIYDNNSQNPTASYRYSFTETKGFGITQGWGDWLQFHQDADAGFFALHSPQNQNAMTFYYMDQWNNPTWGLLSMYNSGLVTIGNAPTTTTGNVSLHYGDYGLLVEKGIMAAKVKVALPYTSHWADYVFDKDYDLMPLDQVEEFISENKHLPNIPSAEELVEEGIDLGQMDAKLLEKIEELTLHLINQEKTIKVLQERIQVLEKNQ